jgi:hypothetical protein
MFRGSLSTEPCWDIAKMNNSQKTWCRPRQRQFLFVTGGRGSKIGERKWNSWSGWQDQWECDMTFTVLNCQSGRRSEWNTDNSEMVRVLYHIPVGSIIRIVGSGSLCYFNRRGDIFYLLTCFSRTEGCGMPVCGLRCILPRVQFMRRPRSGSTISVTVARQVQPHPQNGDLVACSNFNRRIIKHLSMML